MYLFFKQNAPNQKTVNALEVDSLKVNMITIKFEADTLNIIKKDQIWVINDEDQDPINPKRINDFFRYVISAKRSVKLLSKDFKKHLLYNVVKERGIQICLYDSEEQILSDFIIGNGDFSSFSSLRFTNSDEVYELDSNISQYIYPMKSMWLDPVILHFNKDLLNSIEVESQRHQYSFTLENKRWIFRNNKEEFEVFTANRSFFKILNILSNVQSTYKIKFDSEEIKSKDIKEIATIYLGFTDQTKQKIQVYTFDEENCVVIINDLKHYYVLSYDFINRFTKSPENFKDYSDQTY